MAYRWNGVECDTYEELMRLQCSEKPTQRAASVKKASRISSPRLPHPDGYAPNWSGCPFNPQCTKGGDCNCDRLYD